MPKARKTPTAESRRRVKRRGVTRVKVQARKEHAAAPARGLKALLAAAPLDGIDLERAKDRT